MRNLLLLPLAALAFGCSSGDGANSTALKPPPAPNTSTTPGTADPNVTKAPGSEATTG